MKKICITKRMTCLILAMVLCLAALLPMGCGSDNGGATSGSQQSSSTPSEESTPAESSPEESTPSAEPLESYNITYDLDGGMVEGNPASYNKESSFTLKVPVKVGYDFAGWVGTGVETATKNVTIEKGTEGDLSFTATWTENTARVPSKELDNTYFGRDDGISENPDGISISTKPDLVGGRGEGVYVIKTVYTDIQIDSVKDAAYSYGVCFRGDIPNTNGYYDNRETYFDVYLIRGQDGRIYVYVDVVDPDVVVNASLWNLYNFYVDSFDIYIDYGNMGIKDALWCVVADPTGTFKYKDYGADAERTTPPEWKVTLTDKGYSLEFAFDNNGLPFTENDTIGLGYYINDANDYSSLSSYVKYTLKTPSHIYPSSMGYKSPDPTINDAIRTSLESATGRFEVESKTPEKTGDMLTDIRSGAASVGVIYNSYATAQTVSAATNIVNMLRRNGAVYVDALMDKNIPEGKTYDYEILIGMTDRKVTGEAMSVIGYTECGAYVSGNSIALIGWNENAAAGAYGIFCEMFEYILDGGSISDFGTVYEIRVEGLVGADVPALDKLDSITDVGENAYQIYKTVSNLDEYNGYLKALEAAGYKLHTSNEMGNVKTATYYSDDTVVSVQFAGGDSSVANADLSLRIIVEPLSNTALPSTEKPEDANAEVTVTSITMMAPHNLCLVIQLSNGHFIVFDSGNNGTQKGISDFLRKKAPDGKPVVEAWFFTHFHQDHIGGFVDFVAATTLLRYTTIESVIYNFPQEQVVQTAKTSTTDMNNMKVWPQRLEKLRDKGATVYQARTGQKYYFGNAEIEVLWTFEDIMPLNIYRDRTNPTCVGYRITVGGNTILVTGDSSEEQFKMAYNKFGSYLKSDFVQLSHHGQGEELFRPDQPEGGYTIKFYQAVGAPYVLNPGTGGNMGYGETWAKENCEKYFVRDELGICTIPLPYDGDDDYESAKK